VYAGNPDQLSVRAAFPKLHRLEQAYGSLIVGQLRGARARARDPEQSRHSAAMFSFRDGMQTFTDAIARRLRRIELDVPVLRIERRNDAYVVQTGGARLPRTLSTRAVVLALPAYAAANLVASLAPAAAAALAAIAYPPVAVVASGYRRSAIGHSLDGFGFLVPKSEGRQILGTIFSSALFDDRAPAGSALLTTFVGGARQPALAQRDDADVAALVQAEHAAILGAPERADFVDVRRWPRAIPQYALGHLQRIAVVEDAERALPGLHLCANYRGGVSLGDCIRSAAETVERVLAG
jgi:oxygen-dependent protoporphyrinogen oxidase